MLQETAEARSKPLEAFSEASDLHCLQCQSFTQQRSFS